MSPDWNAETPIYQGIYYTLLDWKPLYIHWHSGEKFRLNQIWGYGQEENE